MSELNQNGEDQTNSVGDADMDKSSVVSQQTGLAVFDRSKHSCPSFEHDLSLINHISKEIEDLTYSGQNKVTQKNLAAGGDIAGNNIYKPTYHLHAPTIYHEDTTLKSLLIEHEKERQINPSYREFSDELNKFFSKAVHGNLRNLEQKLTDGNRDYLISAAMDSKERVTKKIQRLSHYNSAQEIYTYLLTNIRTAFLHEVQSKIKAGSFSMDQIDDIVSEKIIGPFLHNLQGSSLNIDKDELYGVLYFLAGNCHIAWD